MSNSLAYHQNQLTTTTLNYALRQLAVRAGVQEGNPSGTGFEGLGVSVQYGRLDEVQLQAPGIVITPCVSGAWDAILERTLNSLDWLPVTEILPPGANSPLDASLPVLFWGMDSSRPFAELYSDGIVVFNADIVAAILFMLSRWEEMVVPVRDEHDRFPATTSVAYKQGFLDRPIVDEYALVLREWLKVLLPQWKPRPFRFSIKLSYDVDAVYSFASLHQGIRVLVGDLLKRHSLKNAWWTTLDIVWRAISPEQTSCFRNIGHLARLSSMNGLEGAFYFMTAEPGLLDNGYDPRSPLVRHCIKDLRRQGFEIGFHPGYRTWNNPEQLAVEKARLDAVLGETRYGGRQHYLRFQVPDTWRYWEQVGLTYDSTMTYADYEGFRCGTCYPFHPFDLEQNRELDLWEVPLIVMDSTLRGYRGLEPGQAEERILELARRCKQVGGTFTLLWHILRLSAETLAWQEMYQRVLKLLGQMKDETHQEVLAS